MRFYLIFIIIVCSQYSSAQKVYDLTGGVESPLLFSGAAGIGISIPIGKKIQPFTISEIIGLDSLSVNGFDRAATRTFAKRAQKASDIFLYSSPVPPLTLVLNDGARNQYGTVTTMYFETILVNYGITELAKVLAKRTRPYAYNGRVPQSLKTHRDTRKSFFSGHTSQVAASSFFTAKVLSDYNTDDDFSSLYWISAAAIPALTAYLRVKGGKHFPTDVITGYIVGALVGILIPELHKL